MKSEQLSASLSAYAGLLREARCEQAARDLELLATVFDRGGDQKVTAIVKKIAKGWTSVGRVAEHPALLKSLLEHIASASKAAAATAAAKDYDAVISLFAGPGDASARAFAEAAIRPLEAVHAPAQPPPPDQALIRSFADRLVAASSDNARFDAIVSELRAARRFSNAILAAIANAYLGTEMTYKSKAEILNAITNHQLQDAIQGSRDRRIVKIAV
jgi:O6-methylguanine-DNA--protein-cysteine methyltransferase